MDQRCGRPEAQKILVDPHFGQNWTPLFEPANLDRGLFVTLEEGLGDFGAFTGLYLRDFVLLGRFASLVA
jgi:hypothetical protein